jgi:hypothetical protein
MHSPSNSTFCSPGTRITTYARNNIINYCSNDNSVTPLWVVLLILLKANKNSTVYCDYKSTTHRILSWLSPIEPIPATADDNLSSFYNSLMIQHLAYLMKCSPADIWNYYKREVEPRL